MKGGPAARRCAALALVLVSATGLQACVDALIVGGVATGVMLAADRRQAEVIFADQRIEFAASSRIGEALKGQGHVNVTSYNSMVLLTGEVPTAQAKAEVEKIVSEVPQVKTVVNELQIAGTSSAASRSNDAYITSKVKGSFLDDFLYPSGAARDLGRARHRRGTKSRPRLRVRRSARKEI